MQDISTHWVLLLGTAGSWFIFDITFYGNSLFSGDVTQAMGVAKTPLDEAWQNMTLNLIAMPGYLLAIVFMDMIGRARLQWLGFVGVAIIFTTLAVCQRQLAAFEGSYLWLYGLTFLLSDFGPNTTTFVISATVFPTTSRATCAGISAALGKLGAVVGGLMFKPIEVTYGIKAVFYACAAVSILGGAWTVALVDDRESATLDEGYSGSVDGMAVEDFVPAKE